MTADDVEPIAPDKNAPLRSTEEDVSDADLQSLEGLVESLPPEDKKVLTRVIASFTQYAGPAMNPLTRKITSEHINKIIDYTEADSERNHDASRSTRRYAYAYFATSLVALGFLVWYLASNDETNLLQNIITGILGFGGGFGVGKLIR